MSKLIEDISLRDKLHVFTDRKEAGLLLARQLQKYKGTNCLILAIPSGGVPVASEIAHYLNIPMELIVVRKIQIPYNTEAGFGAMGPDGEVILNNGLLNQLRLGEDEIRNQIKETKDVIQKRNQLFRGAMPIPSLEDKIVVVVDDGLASGYTMLAAVRYIKSRRPKKIVVAVPTSSERTIDFVIPESDELICLNVRSRFPFAVADAYKHWHDLTDEEVLDIFKKPINPLNS